MKNRSRSRGSSKSRRTSNRNRKKWQGEKVDVAELREDKENLREM